MFLPNNFLGKLYRRYILMGPHPSRVRLQNIAGSFLFSKGISMVNSDKVKFTLKANDWITRIILKEGGYEAGSTTLAKKILDKGGLFIDIGANFGLFTCVVAHSNDKIKVLAVEPNYKVIANLIHNIQLNGLEKRVIVFNAAISNKLQWVTMDQPAKDNLGTTVTRAGCQGLLSILSCPLEFLFRENNIKVADLIKIDIEGKEFEILENFPFDVYQVKNIILEFNHLSHISFDKMRDFFITKNFKSYTITGVELVNVGQEIPENNIWFVNQNTSE
ncbi:MAG: FkbM family methyltransferase [Bacteroidetes bacterium]|nr:FkbM family methyltransferase [Bacteroidota bacterium]